MRHVLPIVCVTLFSCGGGKASAPVATDSVSVGPAGGVLQTGPLTLTIPPGALAATVTVKATFITPPDALDPLALPALTLTLEPAGTTLAVPATLSLALAGAKVPIGLPDGRLRLYRLGTDWTLVESTASATSVEASITSFGTLGARVWAESGSCAGADYRAFDFWVGEWTIADHASQGPPASSSITFDSSGCYILEHFSYGPYQGRSVSFYNGGTQTWYQTYRDTSHGLEELSGTGGNGVMNISGTNAGVTYYVTYTRLDKDHVHHQSEDLRGSTRKLSFDGYYTRN